MRTGPHPSARGHAALLAVAAAAAAFALVGCEPSDDEPLDDDDTAAGDDDTTPSGDDDDDTTPAGDPRIHDVEITVGEVIPTLLTVRWQTSEPTTGLVEYGPAGEPTRVTPLEATAAIGHAVTLRGLPADHEIAVQIRAWTDGGDELVDAPRSGTTGPPPAALPPIERIHPAGDEDAGGFTAFNLIGEMATVPVMIDGRGRYVWFLEPSEPNPFPRFALASDRSAFLLGLPEMPPGEEGAILRISFDGTEESRIEAPGLHLDFTEVPPGRHAYLGSELRALDGGQRWFRGDTLVEVDEQGVATTLWSVFDDFAPDLAQSYPPYGPDADGITGEDWTHFNGLHYDPVGDRYLLTNSSPGLEVVLSVERASGELEWVLGDTMGEFDSNGPERLVQSPHSAQAVDGGVLVFNRGDLSSACSRAVELALDREAHTATEVWAYESEDCLINYFFGQATRLDDGHTLVTWTTAGQLDEVDAHGDLVWRVRSDVGFGIGYAQRLDALY